VKIWVTSDTHFGHNKMVERGYRPPGFEGIIASEWDKHIGRGGDMVIHLGDYILNPAWNDEILALNGYPQILLRGNHDKKSLNWYMNHGFDLALDRMSFQMFGVLITFSHEPLDPDENDFDLNIHGHLHEGTHRGAVPDDGMHYLISLEQTNFRPLTLAYIVNKWKEGNSSYGWETQ